MMLAIIKVFMIFGDDSCSSITGTDCSTGLPKVSGGTPELQQILQIVFGISAALAVLFVVIGALRFVVSDGDPQDSARARNTIIYALIGLLIALAAEAIVSFALNKL
jgi:hypothetical protein